MKSTSSTGSNEIKSVIIKPPLILQFIAAFSNEQSNNIIPVPAFYHTQWAPQYLEFVHLRYNGAIYKIQVRRHKERVYLADGLENFRKQLGIYESTTIQFFACDHHSPFDIHFIPTLERQTCGRQRHSSRKHMWTIQFTQEMVGAPEPLLYLLGVHIALMQQQPNTMTIIVPQHPQQGREVAKHIACAALKGSSVVEPDQIFWRGQMQKLEKEGQNVVLRSQYEKFKPRANIYVVDTLGELRLLYTLMPITVIGGSLLPGWSGHNISEAAAAGCAVLTGFPVGHFSHMVLEMQRSNPLSVLQFTCRFLENWSLNTLSLSSSPMQHFKGIQESKTMRNEV
ncbi:putative 3-deoxy-D-manno-octulosonic acid transferase, mitochondrial [Glycine max]|nr:putative 3-deoxy-D-manno-octulosonic acid transferase, mitochondrial [Glycine max]KAH1216903.1 putative 3-deoxy-D-manno-octulosonic acid transferase, mitochondrial [Glycine max]